jgi:uncharacterized protein YbjT (DUF2867 family)
MIVITGATGVLNGTTTDHLLRSTPADQIVVVARDVDKAARFAERGVAIRYGDYDDPASLPEAFAGADQLLLVSSNDPTADGVSLLSSAIDAAKQVGVGRVLYTSHQGAAADSPFLPARDHAATEELLAASGLRWTSLRNGFYLHSLDWLLGLWRETGVISVPVEGPVSWTSRTDAGVAAAAIIAADSTAHDGPVTLTASDAPTFAEIAELASDVTGRRIGFEMVDRDDWVRAQVEGGSNETMARFLLGMYDAASGGFFAGTDPRLRTLLGREPRTVREHLAG